MHFLVSSNFPGQILFHFADERAKLGAPVRELGQDLHPSMAGWVLVIVTAAPVLPCGCGGDHVFCRVIMAVMPQKPSVAKRVWETAWFLLSSRVACCLACACKSLLGTFGEVGGAYTG